MSDTKKPFKVLKDASDGPEWQIRVLTADGFSYPKKGDVIELGERSEEFLVASGFVEAVAGEPVTPGRPRKPKVRAPKKAVNGE